ncbi:hypothetical protein [Pontimicrobium sp. SW4]|uniref:ABC transporter permease n=1 Tax=Pontimicrobium sp. SW4 TaxID=3153519 RepID=A0AAU7BU79_9FLAO
MDKKVLVSVILGTLLLFLWNVISWMALPFHTKTLKTIPESVI